MQQEDEKFMSRAIQLAEMGKFNVAPNPRVGAVIVHKGKIIGEGYHRQYGEAHAEVNAVKAVQNKSLLQEATIYVTLEPCAHFGKTPPCADLLVQHQFKRVVIANQDPFEEVNGGGIEKLRQAGIEVIVNCLKEQGEKLNQRFFCFHRKKRPFIILKWAETKDGFIGRTDGGDGWITNTISKQLVHTWRAEEAAILVGKNTVLADDPELTVREVEGKNPTRIVVDGKLNLPSTAKIFNANAQTVILNEIQEKAEGNIQWVKTELEKRFIKKLYEYCYRNKLQSIIIEGGANILNQFIRSGMWDEARVFIGEKTFGEGIPAPEMHEEPEIIQQIMNDRLMTFKNKKQ